MRLEHIRLREFRNIAEARLSFAPQGALLAGGNGEGKTNLLEAIGLLASGRSFRRAPPATLCRHGCAAFQVTGRSQAADMPHDISFHGSPGGMQARLNGKEIGSASGLGQALACVVCTPESLRLAQGGPQERRRFLDWIAFQRRRSHAAHAVAYAKAMRARNLLLRKGGSARELDAWEEQLARLGGTLACQRRETLARLNQSLAACLDPLLPPGHHGEILLECQLDQDGTPWATEQEAADRYRALLSQHRERDRREGNTTSGPHRDDLLLRLDGRSLHRFGSQGQQKRFVLAMKLAEAALLRESLGEPPLFLLDDPASEVDPDGVALLMTLLHQAGGQLFVTACRPEEIPWPADADHSRFAVAGGVFSRF